MQLPDNLKKLIEKEEIKQDIGFENFKKLVDVFHRGGNTFIHFCDNFVRKDRDSVKEYVGNSSWAIILEEIKKYYYSNEKNYATPK